MSYDKFSLKAALELAAPPTWVASVGPCFIAGALALCCWILATFLAGSAAEQSPLATLAVELDWRSALCWVLMLCCAALMQSATNALNDYHDFMSGLDTAETVHDESDASIVYNHINPKAASAFAVGLLVAAAAMGVAAAALSSWWLVVWGLIAAAVLVLYSAGPRPISSLPLGEVVSGTVMGGIITCATFYAMTLHIAPVVFALALIPVVAIAQIMQTNNTCDIDRDLAVGRKTMPSRIGRKRSSVLNAALSIAAFLWLGILLVWTGLYAGLVVLAAGLLLCAPKIGRLLKGPYDLINRGRMMGTVVTYAIGICSTAMAALLVGGVVRVII